MNSGREFGSFQSAPPPAAIVQVEVEEEEKRSKLNTTKNKKSVRNFLAFLGGPLKSPVTPMINVIQYAPGGARRARDRARCRPKRGRLELELNTSPATKLKCWFLIAQNPEP